jgi:hypothetical protein
LANTTLSSTATSITFSSIPATYRDLVLVFNGVGPSGQPIYLRYNNDTGANYPSVRMYNTASDTQTPPEIGFGNVNLTAIANIMDYSATDKHKTTLIRWGNADGTSYVMAWASRWASTNAINTLNITTASGTIASGSTFALYGIVS